MARKTPKKISPDAFGALPASTRKLLREAPYDVPIDGIAAAIKRLGKLKAERIIRKSIELEIRFQAILTYGPDHPQAQK